MRKIVILCMLSFLSVSCFQTEEAKAVDKKIKSIGAVTLESESAITEAEIAVEALLESDKAQLRYKKKLVNAREKYNQLVIQDKIKTLEKRIDELVDITVTSKDLIDEVRFFYEEQEQAVRDGVTNYDKLIAAETLYEELIIANAIQKINEIGDDVNIFESTLPSAFVAFCDLNKEQMNKVSNADMLQEKITKYLSFKDNAKTKLEKEYDKFRDITFYKTSETFRFFKNSYFTTYLASTDEEDFLHLIFHYAGDDYIFMNEAIVLVDGESYTIPLQNVKREYLSYFDFRYEHADVTATDIEYDILKKIINGKDVEIRLHGEYYKDFYVDLITQNQCQKIVDAFAGLKYEIKMFDAIIYLKELEEDIKKIKPTKETEA